MKTVAKLPNGPASTRKRARTVPRVVYTQAPLQLAAVVAREGNDWRVRIGVRDHVISADPAVDPALLDDAVQSGSRVVIDATSHQPVIVGLLVTARALTVDRQGVVDVGVRSLRIAAEEEITLKTPRSFIRMQGDQLETYGQQILTRARGVLRLLGVAIKLN